LSAFHKVQWLHFTGAVDKFVVIWCDVSSGFSNQKLLKSVNFWLSYLKKIKVAPFLGPPCICVTKFLVKLLVETFYLTSAHHWDRWLFASIPSWYVTSHLGQLSLLPSAGWKMSTGQGAVAALFGWEGNRIGLSLTSQILWHIHLYELSDLSKGDEQPIYTLPYEYYVLNVLP